MKAPKLIPLVAAASLAFAFTAQAETITEVADGTMVEITGKVVAMEGRNLIVDQPDGAVRVHMYNRVEWSESYEKNPKDALGIGDPVTVYGKVGNGGTKIEADAVYVPAFGRLFISEQKGEVVSPTQRLNFDVSQYLPLEG